MAKRASWVVEDSSDDSDEEEKPVCKYGAKCFRKNPEHLKQFSHLSDKPKAAKDTAAKKPPTKKPRPPSPAETESRAGEKKGSGGMNSGTDSDDDAPVYATAPKSPKSKPKPKSKVTDEKSKSKPKKKDADDNSDEDKAGGDTDSDDDAEDTEKSKKPAAETNKSAGETKKPAAEIKKQAPKPAAAAAAAKTGPPKKKPMCKYGIKCYRNNLLHFAEFDHPTKALDDSSPAKKSGTASKKSKGKEEEEEDLELTQQLDDSDEEDKNKDDGHAKLTRKYSMMTEDERKKLIADAIAAKEAFEEREKQLKEELEKKNKELEEQSNLALQKEETLKTKMEKEKECMKQEMEQKAKEVAEKAKELEQKMKQSTKELEEKMKKSKEESRKELEEKERQAKEAEAEKARLLEEAEALKKKELSAKLQVEIMKKKAKQNEEELERREKELSSMKSDLESIRNGAKASDGKVEPLRVKGEEEALKGTETKYFALYPQRTHDNSAEQIHFRLAESQFYRLMEQRECRVTKVEYVISPAVVKRFEKAREDLVALRGKEKTAKGDVACEFDPVLGFHGTELKNIKPICENGFRVPGKSSDFKHSTDAGWYGRGVYFSEFPDYAMEYISKGNKILLCQVLLGKIYQCDKVIHGASLVEGHDSHMSPDGKEVVIFDADKILPSYVVHYEVKKGNFSYGKKTQEDEEDTNEEESKETEWVVSVSDKEAYKEAKKKTQDKKDIFKGVVFGLSGKLVCSQKELMDLLEEWGGSADSNISNEEISFLLSTKAEIGKGSAKVTGAIKRSVPVIKQTFLFDCIINGRYEYSLHETYSF